MRRASIFVLFCIALLGCAHAASRGLRTSTPSEVHVRQYVTEWMWPSCYAPDPPNHSLPRVAMCDCGPMTPEECQQATHHGGIPSRIFASAGGVRPPIINPYWTQSAWGFDGSNASGCASDANTCTQTSCGSGNQGPCLTMAEIYARWGTVNPILKQYTTISQLSSSVVTDPTTLVPFLYTPDGTTNVSLDLICTLPSSPTATTINTLTAKNTATNQPLSISYASGSLILGQMIVNTTRSNSIGWVRRVSGGFISQPGTTTALPVDNPTFLQSVWSAGDSINVYAPFSLPTVYLLEASVRGRQHGNSGGSSVHVKNCNIQSTAGSGVQIADLVAIGEGAYLIENSINRSVSMNSALLTQKDNNKLENVYSVGGGSFGSRGLTPISSSGAVFIHGGVISNSGGSGNGVSFVGAVLKDDVVIVNLNSSSFLFGASYLVSVENEGPNFLVCSPGASCNLNSVFGAGTMWGFSGTYVSNGTTCYPSGAGKAATTFPIGTLLLANQSAGCIDIPTSSATTLTCNSTMTAANLDTQFGTTLGALFAGASEFTNLNKCN